jgi:hypothetical protein
MMKRLVCVVSFALIATSAGATTVDFNSYSPLGRNLSSVSYQGLNFTAGAGTNSPCGVGCMYVFGGSSPNGNGTPALIYGFGDPMTITKTNGGAFNLDDLQMTMSWYNQNPAAVIQVMANFFGGGSLVENLTLGQGLQTYTLGLDNVTSVSFSDFPHNAGYWLMDNVNYNLTPESVVTPEPGSLLLLGTGLIGLAVAIRSKVMA